MSKLTESEALCFLNSVNGINKKELKILKKRFGNYVTAALAYEHEYLDILSSRVISEINSLRSASSIPSVKEKLECSGIFFTSLDEESYPARLRHIPDPPEGLYYYGSLPDNKVPSVAIIGARNCSGYGRQMAREFAREIAGNGIQVISGMARGIDSISQESAFAVNGYTCSVLGNGIDICYPRENLSLYEKCKLKGGIVSEYPPGTAPHPRLFPARNRIISGLSDSVIVIEAREHSGTLITVNMALEQGIDVYALPGRINESLSYGCNLLIKDGATPLLRPEDFLDEFYSRLGKSYHPAVENSIFIPPALTREEYAVLEILDYYPKSINEIYENIQDIFPISLVDTMQLLTTMVLSHKIKCPDGQNYCIDNI